MAAKTSGGPIVPQVNKPNDKKRKSTTDINSSRNGGSTNKRPKTNHHAAKQREARQLVAQSATKVYKGGELDVDKFIKAREFEIRAFEDGMSRSKKANNQRAFQQVPNDLRRRSASHNVKRVPKRLRKRSKKEMLDDNTPTVTSRRRKPSKRMRKRLDTVEKLRALALLQRKQRKQAEKAKKQAQEKGPETDEDTLLPDASSNENEESGVIKQRATTKLRHATLAEPPLPKARFRKRQINKTWLPTHLFHAKRAQMTVPSRPLWRFSLPVTPTMKSYRPTHRANSLRGVMTWDSSYMATIGLKGREASLHTVLKGMGVGMLDESELAAFWGKKGIKWRRGLRATSSFCRQRELPHSLIAPITVTWCPLVGEGCENSSEVNRRLFIRVHPSAFFETWEEVVRLSKVAKPSVAVEDLRFEIGSITISGPSSTEALHGALHVVQEVVDENDTTSSRTSDMKQIEQVWRDLAALPNTALLPSNALLAFDVQDPRLRHPPRRIEGVEEKRMLTTLTEWPIDECFVPANIYDRKARVLAGSKLASQKNINRRKAAAIPGEFPTAAPRDSRIPILLYTCTSEQDKSHRDQHHAWTLLLPWACVQPVWNSLMYVPISTGGQPSFGGQDQLRQVAFEKGQPWFPGDYPATRAGWQWELEQRQQRFEKWKARPKSKRLTWEKVDLGQGRRGEVGVGWACDWDRLISRPAIAVDGDPGKILGDGIKAREDPGNLPGDGIEAPEESTASREHPSPPMGLRHATAAQASQMLLANRRAELTEHHLATVRLTLLTKGVPTTCARIYRLPAADRDHKLRAEWLGLRANRKSMGKNRGSYASLARLPKDTPSHILRQRLAASLLEPVRVGDDAYPACPPEEDLIGFVTTGNFNLAEGKGIGIGCILLNKVVPESPSTSDEARLCIVRRAGGSSGRLARWDLVGH